MNDTDLKDLMYSIIARAHIDTEDSIEEFENICENDIYKLSKVLVYVQGTALYTIETMVRILGTVKTRKFLNTAMVDIAENIIKQSEILENDNE